MFEELKPHLPWITPVLTFLGGALAGWWGAIVTLGSQIRALAARILKLEVRVDGQSGEITKLEAADRAINSRVQDMGDAINRVEGKLDQLTDLRHEVRQVSHDLNQLSGQMKLYPQLLESIANKLEDLQRK
jgi:predicted  nucleic acid-binding Zn-ribbon protein